MSNWGENLNVSVDGENRQHRLPNAVQNIGESVEGSEDPCYNEAHNALKISYLKSTVLPSQREAGVAWRKAVVTGERVERKVDPRIRQLETIHLVPGKLIPRFALEALKRKAQANILQGVSEVTNVGDFVGREVLISGVEGSSEFIGMIGVVGSFNVRSQRFIVYLYDGKTLLIGAENLSCRVAAEEEIVQVKAIERVAERLGEPVTPEMDNLLKLAVLKSAVETAQAEYDEAKKRVSTLGTINEEVEKIRIEHKEREQQPETVAVHEKDSSALLIMSAHEELIKRSTLLNDLLGKFFRREVTIQRTMYFQSLVNSCGVGELDEIRKLIEENDEEDKWKAGLEQPGEPEQRAFGWNGKTVLFDVQNTIGCVWRTGEFRARPGLEEIRRLKGFGYRIGLYTNKFRVNLPLEQIEKAAGMKFDHVFTGEESQQASDAYCQANGITKYSRIKALTVCGELGDVLLVDDTLAKVAPWERHRVVVVSPWTMKLDDKALYVALESVMDSWEDRKWCRCGSVAMADCCVRHICEMTDGSSCRCQNCEVSCPHVLRAHTYVSATCLQRAGTLPQHFRPPGRNYAMRVVMEDNG